MNRAGLYRITVDNKTTVISVDNLISGYGEFRLRNYYVHCRGSSFYIPFNFEAGGVGARGDFDGEKITIKGIYYMDLAGVKNLSDTYKYFDISIPEQVAKEFPYRVIFFLLFDVLDLTLQHRTEEQIGIPFVLTYRVVNERAVEPKAKFLSSVIPLKEMDLDKLLKVSGEDIVHTLYPWLGYQVELHKLVRFVWFVGKLLKDVFDVVLKSIEKETKVRKFAI